MLSLPIAVSRSAVPVIALSLGATIFTLGPFTMRIRAVSALLFPEESVAVATL